MNGRLAQLDGLRACAALFVLVHHTFCMAFPVWLGVHATGMTATLFGWALYGHFGVTVFIVLAGYSLTLRVADADGTLPGGSFGFLRRRARRILPPYLAALALTILLIATMVGEPTGTHWDQSVPTDPMRWVVDALLLHDFVGGRPTAYPFWSIPVEFHIYLLLPLILLLRRRGGSWSLAVGAVVAASALAVVFVGLTQLGNRLHVEYYALFAVALGACVAVRRRPDLVRRVPLRTLAITGVATTGILCAGRPYIWAEDNFLWLDLLLGIAVACAVAHMDLSPRSRTARLFSLRWIAFLGTFSYSIYLVHAPLLQVFWQLVLAPLVVSREIQLAAGWLVAVPMTIGFAYGFYVLAERPFATKSAARRNSPMNRTEPAAGAQGPMPRS